MGERTRGFFSFRKVMGCGTKRKYKKGAVIKPVFLNESQR